MLLLYHMRAAFQFIEVVDFRDQARHTAQTLEVVAIFC
jgi:hypothetical protein